MGSGSLAHPPFPLPSPGVLGPALLEAERAEAEGVVDGVSCTRATQDVYLATPFAFQPQTQTQQAQEAQANVALAQAPPSAGAAPAVADVPPPLPSPSAAAAAATAAASDAAAAVSTSSSSELEPGGAEGDLFSVLLAESTGSPTGRHRRGRY